MFLGRVLTKVFKIWLGCGEDLGDIGGVPRASTTGDAASTDDGVCTSWKCCAVQGLELDVGKCSGSMCRAVGVRVEAELEGVNW